MPVFVPSRRKFLVYCAASWSLMFSRSRSVTSRRNREFSSESRNSIVPAARPIAPVRLFAPPVQGHDTHTQRARNFALQLPLPSQIICLRQLRRDYHPRVTPGHSSLPRSRYEHLFHTTTPSIAVFWTKPACTHKRDIGLNIRPWQNDRALEAVEVSSSKTPPWGNRGGVSALGTRREGPPYRATTLS
jgi:hypothetical protein